MGRGKCGRSLAQGGRRGNQKERERGRGREKGGLPLLSCTGHCTKHTHSLNPFTCLCPQLYPNPASATLYLLHLECCQVHGRALCRLHTHSQPSHTPLDVINISSSHIRGALPNTQRQWGVRCYLEPLEKLRPGVMKWLIHHPNINGEMLFSAPMSTPHPVSNQVRKEQ